MTLASLSLPKFERDHATSPSCVNEFWERPSLGIEVAHLVSRRGCEFFTNRVSDCEDGFFRPTDFVGFALQTRKCVSRRDKGRWPWSSAHGMARINVKKSRRDDGMYVHRISIVPSGLLLRTETAFHRLKPVAIRPCPFEGTKADSHRL